MFDCQLIPSQSRIWVTIVNVFPLLTWTIDHKQTAGDRHKMVSRMLMDWCYRTQSHRNWEFEMIIVNVYPMLDITTCLQRTGTYERWSRTLVDWCYADVVMMSEHERHVRMVWKSCTGAKLSLRIKTQQSETIFSPWHLQQRCFGASELNHATEVYNYVSTDSAAT